MATKSSRCFFVNCKRPVTHSVQRLWQIPGRAPFGLLYCCDAHRPGSGPKYTENASSAAALKQRLTGRTFYDVRPIEHDPRERNDDDGRTYADPRDHRDGLE